MAVFRKRFKKNPTILNEIVSFMKIVIALRLIARKHSQKNNYDVIADDISLPICNLDFRKFKNNKSPNKLSVFGLKMLFSFI